jgi:diguanylate cyclase (GGDEF)-like protein
VTSPFAAFASPRLAVAPAVATPRAMATTAGVLYFVAGLLTLIAFALPQKAGVPVEFVRKISFCGLGSGVAILLLGPRIPRWGYHVLLLLGNAFIIVGVYEGGGGTTSIACTTLFMFVAVDVFFFFAWPWAVLHLAIAVGSCVASLALVGALGDGQVIITPGALIAVALVVGRLVRAADAAETDPLTRLPNRRGLERVLGQDLARAAQTGNSVTLIIVDIDHFKTVNDALGPVGGDRLLRSIAQAWRPLLREGESLSRHGGDEFALLLEGCPLAEAPAAAKRLRDAMPSGTTCSAGITAAEPGDTVSLLIGRADAALHEAKMAGRNCTSIHEGNRGAEAAELRRAIADGEMAVFYQPVVDLKTGIVTGVEALVRWIRSDSTGPTIVPPDSFIPLAEASGVIDVLGRWVLVEACRQTAAWSAQGSSLVVNVNVSGRQLTDPAYAVDVLAVLATTGLPAHQLVLEVTETTLDGTSADAFAALTTLRSSGVRVAIDDFGTGYSSLSRLDGLPVDVIKIDRSFVSKLTADATRAPLVAAIIAMAGAMGLTVVAEGIEELHQAQLLDSLGCNEGQGYWFDRPLPASHVNLGRRPLGVLAVS